MPVMIRIDDIKKDTKSNKLKYWIDTCRAYNIKTTLAVSPEDICSNRGVVSLIYQALDDGHDISLHGFSHKCHLLPIEKHKKMTDMEHEFLCDDYGPIPFEYQRKWIGAGKKNIKKIFGKDVSSFTPPQHRYDSTTLEALKSERICKISLARNYYTDDNFPSPHKDAGFLCIPVFYCPFDYLTDLKERFWKIYNNLDYIGLNIHVQYLNKEKIEAWKKIFEKINEETRTISEISGL